jgi:translation elongation factor EF-1beta
MKIKTLLREPDKTITQALRKMDDEELKAEVAEKLELTKHTKNVIKHKRIPVAFGGYGDAIYVRYWGDMEISRVP